jgi:hypothetical protein
MFAAAFLFGDRLRPLKWLGADKRTLTSFGSGMSVAYVFVHLMPELAEAREDFSESLSGIVLYEGMAVYTFALMGFVLIYGLEHWRRHVGESEDSESSAALYLHVGGFAVYVALMAYLAGNGLGESQISTALYAIAITLHLIGIDHALRDEHGAAYSRRLQLLLAGMAVVGFGLATLTELPEPAIASLIAFVSGAVIINSTLMELPSDRDGRFTAYLIGAVAYALLLIPLA